MPPRLDLTGQIFGRLTVKEFSHVVGNNSYWLCVCECGNTTKTQGNGLKRGESKSCGCLNKENHTTHGLERHPIYGSWHNMIDRCYNPKNKSYANYGGRGITVCDSWRESPRNFLEDMGDKPEGTSIDRIDSNGNYTKENCRWATDSEQQRNRRDTVLNEELVEEIRIMHAGGFSGPEIAEFLGINRVTIYQVIKGNNWRSDG
jgi:hypothetical protein